jgi:C1A family cysteine protease
MPPVYDQGNLGSCTANALCGAFAYAARGFLGSRLFLYYNTRVIAKNVSYDAGAYVHDGINALKTYGLCAEVAWPYNIRQFTVKPPSMCYKAALFNRVLNAYNVPTTLGAMKACLAGGVPFVLGFIVFSSFQSVAVARTGLVPMPRRGESVVGGHAVLVCGYNDSNQRFLVRNSWGSGWGDRGYFYMPYAYFTNPSLTSDVWAITRAN